MTDHAGTDVEAKMAITELLYRYCRAVDRMDRELAQTVWHADGTVDYGRTVQGPVNELFDVLWASHSKLLGHSHQVTNVLIEVDGATAASEAYVTATLWDSTESGALAHLLVVGRYLDTWSHRDGRWAIDHRRFLYDAVFTPPATDGGPTTPTFARLAEERSQSRTASRRDRNDPSYEVFGA